MRPPPSPRNSRMPRCRDAMSANAETRFRLAVIAKRRAVESLFGFSKKRGAFDTRSARPCASLRAAHAAEAMAPSSRAARRRSPRRVLRNELGIRDGIEGTAAPHVAVQQVPGRPAAPCVRLCESHPLGILDWILGCGSDSRPALPAPSQCISKDNPKLPTDLTPLHRIFRPNIARARECLPLLSSAPPPA